MREVVQDVLTSSSHQRLVLALLSLESSTLGRAALRGAAFDPERSAERHFRSRRERMRYDIYVEQVDGKCDDETPRQFFDFTIGGITCNLAPPVIPPGTPVNPTQALWDDPSNAGRVCRWQDPGTGPLFSVPFGAAYEAGLQAYNMAGRGPESNRVPFSRLAPPSIAPTGLRVIRPGS